MNNLLEALKSAASNGNWSSSMYDIIEQDIKSGKINTIRKLAIAIHTTDANLLRGIK